MPAKMNRATIEAIVQLIGGGIIRDIADGKGVPYIMYSLGHQLGRLVVKDNVPMGDFLLFMSKQMDEAGIPFVPIQKLINPGIIDGMTGAPPNPPE